MAEVSVYSLKQADLLGAAGVPSPGPDACYRGVTRRRAGLYDNTPIRRGQRIQKALAGSTGEWYLDAKPERRGR
jgi:hypothetical protein